MKKHSYSIWLLITIAFTLVFNLFPDMRQLNVSASAPAAASSLIKALFTDSTTACNSWYLLSGSNISTPVDTNPNVKEGTSAQRLKLTGTGQYEWAKLLINPLSGNLIDTAALQFWFNPIIARNDVEIGIVCESGGTYPSVRIPLNPYLNLQASDYGDWKWKQVTIPFRYIADHGTYYDGNNNQAYASVFNWSRIAGITIGATTEGCSTQTSWCRLDYITFISYLAPPNNLQVISKTDTTISLSWDAPTAGSPLGYKVYRGDTQVGTVTSGAIYTDSGLTAATAYTYYVQAYDSLSQSDSISLQVVTDCQSNPAPTPAGIQPLTIRGQDFIDPSGNPVRFWGVNLVSLYPTHSQADNLASNLAALNINVVRLHHNLRNSLDWNTQSGLGALVTYNGDTRHPNTNAWDRFDYLNARLRDKGIYIRLSLEASRSYLSGDVDILQTDSSDRTAWMNAMQALNSLPWNKSRDLKKMLPMIDERVARLNEEFITYLLTHVNPYTGIRYGDDPQLLTLEVINEASTEYAVICGNRFQDSTYTAISYWDDLLNQKWNQYTLSHGIAPCDLYNPSTTAQKQARSDFLIGLDTAYFNRIKNLVRNLGCQTPISFSNLWRGESFQKMHSQTADYIEDHNYVDPFIARSNDDLFNYTSRTALSDKPYFVGELNQALNDASITQNAPYRTMLPLSAAAYGVFNNWSGINFFAWNQGDRNLGTDGWAINEVRTPSANSDMIGEIQTDGMMIDHFRTAGIMFRNSLVDKSTNPVVLYVDDPCWQSGYYGLMSPKYQFKLGWQNIHSIRKAYGTVPPSQSSSQWMTVTPSNPVISDTGQIIKDVQRKQLTVSAPQAEAFGGMLDSQPISGLKHISIGAASGFATVIMVSNDNNNIEASKKLIISRTGMNSSNQEIDGPDIKLEHIMPPPANMQWQMTITRPKSLAGVRKLDMVNPGELFLPSGGWHECELNLVNILDTDSLTFINSEGSQITEIKDAGNLLKGKAVITNYTLDVKPVSVIMALYKGNKLLRASVQSSAASPGSNTVVHPGLSIPSDGSTYRARLYVWDNVNSAAPLSGSAELK